MEKCREEINDFEVKYSMSFEEFKAKLGKELELSWEHEKDFFFWEGAKTDLKKLEEYKENKYFNGREKKWE